ncbi:hypothetical protein LCGC14_0406660 [marine sediment metagenome]|uniref:Uncharacterized protein n=1 Tax=marine sediment metagenome TaxID=412755 RepID=A0A0F9VH39_9ZZZZ
MDNKIKDDTIRYLASEEGYKQLTICCRCGNEMKVEAKLEEKHIYHHFDTLLDEKKYYNELRAIANKRIKEINE